VIPDGLVKYTISQLENKAELALRQRPDVNFTAPINLELLVERLPDVELEVRAGLRTNFRCEGCVCKHDASCKDISVIIDNGIYRGPWADYNTVLGEEYAHLILHPALLLYVTTPEDFVALQNDTAWHQFEQDARWFSLAVRMPPKLVREEVSLSYKRIVNEHGFGDTAVVEAFIRNSIAQKFRVTAYDVRRRLSSFPCDIQDCLSNSIQSRSLALLADDWTVRAASPQSQPSLFN